MRSTKLATIAAAAVIALGVGSIAPASAAAAEPLEITSPAQMGYALSWQLQRADPCHTASPCVRSAWLLEVAQTVHSYGGEAIRLSKRKEAKAAFRGLRLDVDKLGPLQTKLKVIKRKKRKVLTVSGALGPGQLITAIVLNRKRVVALQLFSQPVLVPEASLGSLRRAAVKLSKKSGGRIPLGTANPRLP